jgi:hypothetical protein
MRSYRPVRQFLSFVLIIQVVMSVSAGSRGTSNQVQQEQEPINAVTKEDVSTPVESGFTPTQTGSDVLVVTIPRGTVVEIETSYRLSSQEIKAGEALSFRVVNPVRVGEATVIAVGAVAIGRVVRATRGGHFGRAGRLVWTMETVNAVDDSRVPIQAAGRVVGDSKGAKVATRMVLTGALLWPIAPVALLHGFKRGGNAYVAQGRRYEVIVSADTTVRLRDHQNRNGTR